MVTPTHISSFTQTFSLFFFAPRSTTSPSAPRSTSTVETTTRKPWICVSICLYVYYILGLPPNTHPSFAQIFSFFCFIFTSPSAPRSTSTAETAIRKPWIYLYMCRCICIYMCIYDLCVAQLASLFHPNILPFLLFFTSPSAPRSTSTAETAIRKPWIYVYMCRCIYIYIYVYMIFVLPNSHPSFTQTFFLFCFFLPHRPRHAQRYGGNYASWTLIMFIYVSK